VMNRFALGIGLLGLSILLSASPLAAAVIPDDSPAARDAALSRLRAAPPREVCAETLAMSSTFGTSCASREFPALPILTAPRKAWEVKPGWWGAWSPFLVGDLMLTGSCNNDGNEGVSALDTKTGRFVWRIASICAAGNRRGSMGQVAFHELPSGEVLLIYPRENGEPTDHYVIDVKAGRIVRTLTPARRGPARSSQPPNAAADSPRKTIPSSKVTSRLLTRQSHVVVNSSCISDMSGHATGFEMPRACDRGSQKTLSP